MTLDFLSPCLHFLSDSISRYIPSPVYSVLWIKPKALCMLGKQLRYISNPISRFQFFNLVIWVNKNRDVPIKPEALNSGKWFLTLWFSLFHLIFRVQEGRAWFWPVAPDNGGNNSSSLLTAPPILKQQMVVSFLAPTVSAQTSPPGFRRWIETWLPIKISRERATTNRDGLEHFPDYHRPIAI